MRLSHLVGLGIYANQEAQTDVNMLKSEAQKAISVDTLSRGKWITVFLQLE